MTASIAILYATFIAGVGVLVAAWAWGDMPETGYLGESPLQPDKRNVLALEEARVEVRHTPEAPLGRHA
ncbi:MAG: hypothetical protein VB860_12575 [Dehalococcoidia bacterium]|jgi:hypothetical protein